jgi:hypothetical protein
MIPTAEEFKNKEYSNVYWDENSAMEFAIEFAKLHVEAALKAASEKVKCGLEYSHHEGEFEDIPVYEATVDEKSILNAYPESNIK